METQILLRDADIFPSDKVLKDAFGENIYSVLDSFLTTVASEAYGLNIDWRFYNDGKAWLAKITHKKRTILWLSVWSNFFKTSFYFTDKHLEAIAELNISYEIKEEFAKAKPVGKLISLIIDVNNKDQLADILTIVRFKKSLK